MTTVIAKNLHKVTERIDTVGNVIDPRTKQVIVPVDSPYIPTTEELANAVNPQPKVVETTNAPTSKIDDMISKKIEEIINRKIEEALSKL